MEDNNSLSFSERHRHYKKYDEFSWFVSYSGIIWVLRYTAWFIIGFDYLASGTIINVFSCEQQTQMYTTLGLQPDWSEFDAKLCSCAKWRVNNVFNFSLGGFTNWNKFCF